MKSSPPSQLYAVLLGRTPTKGVHAPRAPRTDAQECWDTYQDVLTLLAYVGKADNRLVTKEKAVIRDFIIARGHTAETADTLLKRLARVQLPETREANNLMRRIAAEAGSSLRRDTRALCHTLAAADGVVSDAERDLLARVDRLLMTE